ncbi:MAG: SDR family NAD(P)-dependent oxidoreductase, partial [Erysipelotrichaceae bacterium]|nr:SDR family NAD(P)-dependent oxidoreductase [Erysipelotrichaceae bacterium]
MNNVVITGSARGLGFEMAKVFRKNGYSVALSDVNEKNLASAEEQLKKEPGSGKVTAKLCDVTSLDQLEALWQHAASQLGEIDIWINNAGVN